MKFSGLTLLQVINPLTTSIGRSFFGHKLPAARPRELFKSSMESASLLVDIEKKVSCFRWGFLEVTSQRGHVLVTFGRP